MIGTEIPKKKHDVYHSYFSTRAADVLSRKYWAKTSLINEIQQKISECMCANF